MDIEGQLAAPEQTSITALPTQESTGNGIGIRRSYPAILHAAVVTAFVLPIAFLPYLVARRQVISLQQRIVQLEKNTGVLRNELETTTTLQASTKSELDRLKAAVLESSKGWQDSRRRYNQHEADRRASDEVVRRHLHQVQDETRHYSRTQATAFRALGTSLGDVAAFMEEVELDLGLANGKQRGIERLRALAFRMQTHSGPVENNKSEESTK